MDTPLRLKTSLHFVPFEIDLLGCQPSLGALNLRGEHESPELVAAKGRVSQWCANTVPIWPLNENGLIELFFFPSVSSSEAKVRELEEAKENTRLWGLRALLAT